MSERGTVQVEMPLNRPPDKAEMPDLMRQAKAKAGEIIGPGRILGVAKVYMATHAITSQPTLLVNFAVEAPENLPGRGKP